MLHLSALEVCPVQDGTSQSAAVRACLTVAKELEILGYRRIWVAEHHSDPAFACATPEVLIAVLGAVTRTIRVGTGATLLALHSPGRVAEAVRTVCALHAGRVDLGVGRGLGGMREQIAELFETVSPRAEHIGRLRRLVHLLGSDPSHAGFAVPWDAPGPELWVMGSSVDAARTAGSLGLYYCHAHFLSPQTAAEALAAFRGSYVPRENRPPSAALCMSFDCHRTSSVASAMRGARAWWEHESSNGGHPCFPALDRFVSEGDRAPSSQEQFTTIKSVARESGADEVVLLARFGSVAQRLETYREAARLNAALCT